MSVASTPACEHSYNGLEGKSVSYLRMLGTFGKEKRSTGRSKKHVCGVLVMVITHMWLCSNSLSAEIWTLSFVCYVLLRNDKKKKTKHCSPPKKTTNNFFFFKSSFLKMISLKLYKLGPLGWFSCLGHFVLCPITWIQSLRTTNVVLWPPHKCHAHTLNKYI